MLKNIFKISRSVLFLSITAQVMVGIAGCSNYKASVNEPTISSRPAPRINQPTVPPETDTFIFAVVLHGLGGRAHDLKVFGDGFKQKIGTNGFVWIPIEREGKTFNTSIENQANLVMDKLLKHNGGTKYSYISALGDAIKKGKKIQFIIFGYSIGGPVAQKIAHMLVERFGNGLDFGPNNGKLITHKVVLASMVSPMQGVDIDKEGLKNLYKETDKRTVGEILNGIKIGHFEINEFTFEAMKSTMGALKEVKWNSKSTEFIKKYFEDMIPDPLSRFPAVKDLTPTASTTRNNSLTQNVPTIYLTSKCDYGTHMHDALSSRGLGMISDQLVARLSMFEPYFRKVLKNKDSDGVVPFDSQSMPGTAASNKKEYNYSHLGILQDDAARIVLDDIWNFFESAPPLNAAP